MYPYIDDSKQMQKNLKSDRLRLFFDKLIALLDQL